MQSRQAMHELSSRFTRVRHKLFLPRFLRRMKKLKIGGLSAGNRIALFHDGDACFHAFIGALKNARSSINLETYIFKSDDVGWKIARLMARKARQGLEVNLIYDSWGCLGTSPEIFDYMKAAGSKSSPTGLFFH
jgi:cardiolipin synthase